MSTQNRIIQQNTLENKQGSNWAPLKTTAKYRFPWTDNTHTNIIRQKSPIFSNNMSRPTNTVKSQRHTTLF